MNWLEFGGHKSCPVDSRKQEMSRRKQYTDEYKHEVLHLAATCGKSVAELEHDLGLTSGLLRQ